MRLHLRIIEADNIPKMDLIGKADPFVKVFLTESKDSDKTEYISKTYTPKWNKEMHLRVISVAEWAKFELRDHDAGGKHDLIGTFQRKIKDFQPGMVVDEWINVEKAKGVKKQARVHMVSHLSYEEMCPFYQLPFQFLKVCVNIQGIRGLAKANRSDPLNPYILIGLGICPMLRFKTKELRGTNDPVWNEDIPIELTNPATDVLCLTLRDKTTSGEIDAATLSLVLNQYQLFMIYDNEYDMLASNNLKSGGKIKLKIQILPVNYPNWTQPQMQPYMYPQQMQPGMNQQQMQPGVNPQQMQQGMYPQQMQPGMYPQQMQPGMNQQGNAAPPNQNK